MNENQQSGAALSASPQIRPCQCNHAYQDEKYGPKQRVHNPCNKSGPGIGYRCTVCGSEK